MISQKLSIVCNDRDLGDSPHRASAHFEGQMYLAKDRVHRQQKVT